MTEPIAALKSILQDVRRLPQGAVLQQPLYVPQKDKSLSKITPLAKQVIAYDPFSQKPRQGNIYAFLLEEFEGRPAEISTPNGHIHPFRYDHFIQAAPVQLEELAEEGFVQDTTYYDAYQAVGASGRVLRNLETLSIAKNPVWQVTPKGNGVIFLTKDQPLQKEKVCLRGHAMQLR